MYFSLGFKNLDIFDMFDYYDKDLINNLHFEVRLNNNKIAEFEDMKNFRKYLDYLITIESYNFRWFFYDGEKIVFDLFNDKNKKGGKFNEVQKS